MTAPDALEGLVERLKSAAADLRGEDLSPERAAALVDECARLATEAATQLDREVRAPDEGGPSGQLTLGR